MKSASKLNHELTQFHPKGRILCVLKVVPRIAVRSVFDILSAAIFEEFLFSRVHGSYCHFIELFDLTKRKEKRKSKEFPSSMPHWLPFLRIHQSKAVVS